MNLNLKILIFLISLFIILNFEIGFTQTNTISTTPPVSLPSLQEKEPGKLINQIYNFILAISGFLAFVIIVYAGISRILAAGNTSKITEANQRIQDAFMGILLLLGAYIILRLINPNLVNLKLPELEKIKVKSDAYTSTDVSGGVGLSEDEARKILNINGIDILNNDRTFLQGIKQGTLDELIRMKKECDTWVSKYYPNYKMHNKNECYILVTGGTENIKHNPGVCSHANGYKIDIAPNSMLDKFITETYCMKTNNGCVNYDKRSDGALIYKSPTGSTYAREGNHWDIQITSQCP